MSETIFIGVTKKAFGVQGEIRLKIEKEFIEDALAASVLFIEVNGKELPYFVEGFRLADSVYVKLDEVDTKEKAAKLAGKGLYLRTQDVRPEEERLIPLEEEPSSLFYAKYIGFKLIDQTVGKIGVIKEIEEYPQQEMALLEYEEKEILIPLNEALIVEIKEGEETIVLDLPEGLLEL